MSVIDFHSHVLPRIDDGSHSSEESLGMLQISASQGIDVMAATSHFYATEDRISSFLNRRRWSEERLKERMNQELTKEDENVKFFCNIFSKKIFNIVYLLFIIYNDII